MLILPKTDKNNNLRTNDILECILDNKECTRKRIYAYSYLFSILETDFIDVFNSNEVKNNSFDDFLNNDISDITSLICNNDIWRIFHQKLCYLYSCDLYNDVKDHMLNNKFKKIIIYAPKNEENYYIDNKFNNTLEMIYYDISTYFEKEEKNICYKIRNNIKEITNYYFMITTCGGANFDSFIKDYFFLNKHNSTNDLDNLLDARENFDNLSFDLQEKIKFLYYFMLNTKYRNHILNVEMSNEHNPIHIPTEFILQEKILDYDFSDRCFYENNKINNYLSSLFDKYKSCCAYQCDDDSFNLLLFIVLYYNIENIEKCRCCGHYFINDTTENTFCNCCNDDETITKTDGFKKLITSHSGDIKKHYGEESIQFEFFKKIKNSITEDELIETVKVLTLQEIRRKKLQNTNIDVTIEKILLEKEKFSRISLVDYTMNYDALYSFYRTYLTQAEFIKVLDGNDEKDELKNLIIELKIFFGIRIYETKEFNNLINNDRYKYLKEINFDKLTNQIIDEKYLNT